MGTPAARQVPRRVTIYCFGIVPIFLESASGDLGGAELQLRLWGEQLAQRHHVTFVTRPLRPGEALRDGLPFTFVHLDGAYLAPAARWRQAWRYLRAVRLALAASRPEVCITRVLGFETWLLARACRRSSVRFVFQWASNADLDGRLIAASPWTQRVVRALAVRGRRAADIQVCQSVQQIGFLTPRERARALLVPNLLDTSLPWRPGARAGDRVLWVGTIQAGVKRPDRFLQLARRLPHRRFLMVGEVRGTAAEREAFARAAAAIPNLELGGFLPRAALPAQYRLARVLVNVSDTEGFPNTFLEAAACGVPIVSLSVDPNGILEEGGAGSFLHGNVAALPAAIETFFQDGPWSKARRAGQRVSRQHLPGARLDAAEARIFGDLPDAPLERPAPENPSRRC